MKKSILGAFRQSPSRVLLLGALAVGQRMEGERHLAPPSIMNANKYHGRLISMESDWRKMSLAFGGNLPNIRTK